MGLHLKAALKALLTGTDKPTVTVPEGPDVIRNIPVARFESAYQNWHKRGYVPASLQDARFDVDPSTRRELMRRSRHWEQNSAYLQKMLDLFENFTVGGNGLHIVPNSADEDWNTRAAAWWKKWCQSPARDNRLPLGQLQSMMARSWFVDGEIFIAKTYDSKTGLPAIQLIESNRVETPWSKELREGAGIVDGVETDAAGKPIGYQVRTADASAAYGYALQVPGGQPGLAKQFSYSHVDAENMFHLFEPVRPGLTRGLPMAYAVLNDLQDLYELQDLSMQKARDAARITNVMTTKTGEANVTNAFKNRMATHSQDANGNAVTKNVPQYYEITMGGDTVYCMTGEKFEQFRSEEPGVATQEYWNTLLGKSCIGIGIPRVLVVPYALGGGVLRADIETAAAFFRARSAIIGWTMCQMYVWVMQYASEYVRELRGAPKNWDSVIIRPPRSLSVDLGYATESLIKQLDAGLVTMAEACSEMGKDWREVQDQKGIEWERAQKVATLRGVPVERIMEPPKSPIPPASFAPAKNGNGNGNNGNGHTAPAPNGKSRMVLVP